MPWWFASEKRLSCKQLDDKAGNQTYAVFISVLHDQQLLRRWMLCMQVFLRHWDVKRKVHVWNLLYYKEQFTPDMYTIFKNPKGVSQGNFWGLMVMPLNLNVGKCIQVGPSWCLHWNGKSSQSFDVLLRPENGFVPIGTHLHNAITRSGKLL